MKYFLIVLFFVQLSAVANTNNSAVQVCDNIRRYIDEKIECLANTGYKSEDTVSIMDHYNNNQQEVKGAAIEFCRNEFPSSRSKDDCLNIVAPSRFIDAGAFNLCVDQLTDLRRIECLSVIVNKAYHPFLIEKCKKQSTALRQKECLSKYGSPIDSEEDESVMDHYNNNQQEVKGAAIEFCRNEFPSSRSKDDCLNIVAPSRFIDAGAFNLCVDQSTDLRRIECLSVIVNKVYHPFLIEECKEQSTALRQKECLSKYGSPIDFSY